MSEWHIILEWQRLLMVSMTWEPGMATGALEKLADEEFEDCLQGFLAMNCMAWADLPGVDVDRWLLRLLVWTVYLSKCEFLAKADPVLEQDWSPWRVDRGERLYCSVECQRLSWPEHRLNCAQDVPLSVERSEAIPRCVNLDLDTVFEQLNFALQIMDKSDMDEASCSEVWKAMAVLEHLINVLRPFTDVPVYLQEIEEGVYFANGSIGYLMAKVLVSAAQAAGYAGEDQRAVMYADEAISLLADLRQPHVSNHIRMEDHVVLQASAHFARSLSLSDAAHKRQALDTAIALCDHYGFSTAECMYLPKAHHRKQIWDWQEKFPKGDGSNSDPATSDEAASASDDDVPPPPLPPPMLECTAACAGCGDMVKRNRLRFHRRRQCPSRRVSCPYCSEWCQVAFIDEHQANDCPEFPVPCELCHVSVARSFMGWHKQAECCFRMVSCPNSGCSWRDVAETAELHQERCPFGQQTCAFCMESLQARFMPSHICPMVPTDQTCAVCCDPFADLVKQGILPSILLRTLTLNRPALFYAFEQCRTCPTLCRRSSPSIIYGL
eukprot:Skav233598  [mRNA]  locus=scaffold2520:752291:758772:- [translate_table: standard]